VLRTQLGLPAETAPAEKTGNAGEAPAANASDTNAVSPPVQ
jgi:hypothetical protein